MKLESWFFVEVSSGFRFEKINGSERKTASECREIIRELDKNCYGFSYRFRHFYCLYDEKNEHEGETTRNAKA